MDQQSADPAKVNDLDTAKLALRWALERLRKMSEELEPLRSEVTRLQGENQLAAKQLQEKDQAIERWRGTVKTWESSLTDRKTLEDRIRAELKEELKAENRKLLEDERLRLEIQAQTSKGEVMERDEMIAKLRRQVIDTAKEARQAAEKEIQSLMERQQGAVDETKQTVLERLRHEAEALKKREKDLEDERRSLQERARQEEEKLRERFREMELELIRRGDEAFERKRRAVEEGCETRVAELEERLASREKILEDRRRRLEADAQLQREELERERRWREDWDRRFTEREEALFRRFAALLKKHSDEPPLGGLRTED